MLSQFCRTQMIYGEDVMRAFASSRVAVFGLGGVGGYVVEALARAGIGALDLVDHDIISLSNLNRQILATRKTVGQYKTDAAAARIRDINPECRVTLYRTFFLPETREQFNFSRYDYVVDAIDTVTGKLAIITCAHDAGVPVISSMGTGNKTDPSMLRVADLYETSVCPLAKVMRHECRKRGIGSLKVVYSKELPVRPRPVAQEETEARSGDAATASRKPVPGSTSFVPSAAGLMIAGAVLNDLAAAAGYTPYTGDPA